MRNRFAVVLECLILVGCQRILVPKLTYSLPQAALTPVGSPEVVDQSNNFLKAFCSLYPEAASGEKLDCSHYFRASGATSVLPAPPLADDKGLAQYRIVLIGGFLHTCLSDPTLALFHDAESYLGKHGVTLDRVPLMGIRSVEEDAAKIIEYLRTTTKPGDSRKVILLGYSKGAPDGQAAIVAMQSQPPANFEIAGLITLAGMVGGSRLYDWIADPLGVSHILSHVPILMCPAGERNLDSLSRQQRYQFLRDHMDILTSVPTYAIGTTSTPENTSLVFLPFWNYLSAYGIDQDGQMALVEEIAPGAVYLGVALGDHWAPAMPFETNATIAKIVNHNHYPRTALLEATLRFVVADLPDRLRAIKARKGEGHGAGVDPAINKVRGATQ